DFMMLSEIKQMIVRIELLYSDISSTHDVERESKLIEEQASKLDAQKNEIMDKIQQHQHVLADQYESDLNVFILRAREKNENNYQTLNKRLFTATDNQGELTALLHDIEQERERIYKAELVVENKDHFI